MRLNTTFTEKIRGAREAVDKALSSLSAEERSAEGAADLVDDANAALGFLRRVESVSADGGGSKPAARKSPKANAGEISQATESSTHAPAQPANLGGHFKST